MMALDLQTVAQTSTARMLNTLVEGMAIAGLAWILLRLLRNQNSGTRFAVWFSALLSIGALPLFFHSGGTSAADVSHAGLTLSTSAGRYLFTAWAAIAAVLVARLGISLWQLRKLRQSSIELNPTDLNPALHAILHEFDSPRRIKLCVSDRVRVPAAVGIFRPAVVIPHWALYELTPDELKVVLLHELAHLQRWDDWTNLAQKFLKSLFFFHPAVWWIERRLGLEREMACDDLVLAHTENPHAYASSLIAFAEKIHDGRGLAMAQAVVGRMKQTSLRIAQILDANRPKATRVWKPVLGLAGTIAAIALTAMPYVPELVAFQTPAQSSTVAAVEKMSPAPAIAKAKFTSAKQAHATPQTNAIPVRAKQIHNREPELIQASAKLNVQPAPELVFIMESTQYDMSGRAVWSLCVWRITENNRGQQMMMERTLVMNKL